MTKIILYTNMIGLLGVRSGFPLIICKIARADIREDISGNEILRTEVMYFCDIAQVMAGQDCKLQITYTI